MISAEIRSPNGPNGGVVAQTPAFVKSWNHHLATATTTVETGTYRKASYLGLKLFFIFIIFVLYCSVISCDNLKQLVTVMFLVLVELLLRRGGRRTYRLSHHQKLIPSVGRSFFGRLKNLPLC